MVSVCFYFQVHQPYRIRRYRVFDIGTDRPYFDEQTNRQVLQKVAEKCYLPMNALLLRLLERHPEFKVAFSFSGVVLEQFESSARDVLASFQRLAATGRVELLGETYHHSLAFLFSPKEFREQVLLHQEKIKQLFGTQPAVFRNTELIYNNRLAAAAQDMGYHAVLAEGWDPLLEWRSPNFVYQAHNSPLRLLLKNYRLSDDIAFRFSNKDWTGFPLSAETFASWITTANGNGHVVNLFMDYETFGEHQWAESGIFRFMEQLPAALLTHADNDFVTPSEAIRRYPSAGTLDIPHLVSWADMERDVSAWVGNAMQQSALQKLYALEAAVKAANNPELLESWRKLQTSDHFYYMCTKWFNDGDVHKYFNPYETPYECFLAFMNVFTDFQQRVEHSRVRVAPLR